MQFAPREFGIGSVRVRILFVSGSEPIQSRVSNRIAAGGPTDSLHARKAISATRVAAGIKERYSRAVESRMSPFGRMFTRRSIIAAEVPLNQMCS